MSGILLIHGAWHGLWYWDAFASRLADRGHEVRAVGLRGHDGRKGRIWHRVRHYLEDVERAAAEFAEPPVLVGHSMGGLLAQKHLEKSDRTRGAVLMASVPPGGTIGVVKRLGTHHPRALVKATLLLSLWPLVETPALVRELMFTSDTPQEVVDDCFGRMQDESYPAFVDLLVFALPRPSRVRAPVLVLGAERDGIITLGEVHRTARAYGVRAETFPGMGHDMMLEEGWAQVADRVGGWVEETTP